MRAKLHCMMWKFRIDMEEMLHHNTGVHPTSTIISREHRCGQMMTAQENEEEEEEEEDEERKSGELIN